MSFIKAADGALINQDEVVRIDRSDRTLPFPDHLVTRDQGWVGLDPGPAQRIEALVGSYHPNPYTHLRLIESQSEEGTYVALPIIGWIRCPEGQMLPVTPYGWPLIPQAVDNVNLAFLDVGTGLVITEQDDESKQEVGIVVGYLPLAAWEARTGLKPLCPPKTA